MDFAYFHRLLRGAGQIAQLVYEAKSVDEACAGAIEIVELATRRRNERLARPLSEVLDLTVQQARENAHIREQGTAHRRDRRGPAKP